MPTIDFSNAKQPIDMTDANFVKFGTVEAKAAASWSWLSAAGHDFEFSGSGLTYDAQGRALSGTITSISIDLGNDNFAAPDITITGINAPAAALDDGQAGFWRFLEGDDTIIGPNVANAGFSKLFGDGYAGRAGAIGGNDTFQLGASPVWVAGDVWTVGTQAKGGTMVKYTGGDDSFIGRTTDESQILSGDVVYVSATGELTGGNDRIVVVTDGFAEATGDAFYAEGVAGDLAVVVGGDDEISSSGSPFRAMLTGDVAQQRAYSFVRGGNDVLLGAANALHDIVGDVSNVGGNQMVGGDDWIVGGRGMDDLFGDFAAIGAGGKVVAGNDTIYGGDGDDYIYGDGTDDTKTTGGNDRLFGGDGNDNVRGGTGNDLMEGGDGRDTLIGSAGNDILDGGRDVDYLVGGVGNDLYFVDDAADQPTEDAAAGTDTVNTTLRNYTLGDNLENLTFIGNGDFNAFGNMFNNVIRGGAGTDTVIGLAGNDTIHGAAGRDMLYGDIDNDVLNGGEGGDLLDGGAGFDIASYAGSEQAVKVSLDGTVTVTGDALGDSLVGIEGLEGTSFGDLLVGNGAANRLSGGEGNDTLIGRAGVDTLVGGDGNDVYYAEVVDEIVQETNANAVTGGIDTVIYTGMTGTFTLGNNVERLAIAGSGAIAGIGNALGNLIAGGTGANLLNGKAGKDVLTGGAGVDTFVFDTTPSAANVDTITDMTNADVIRLAKSAFAAIGSSLTANEFRANTTGIAGDADDRVIYETDTGKLFYDTNGNAAGGAVQIALLSGNPSLGLADFQFL